MKKILQIQKNGNKKTNCQKIEIINFKKRRLLLNPTTNMFSWFQIFLTWQFMLGTKIEKIMQI